jgi:hypothetical protein
MTTQTFAQYRWVPFLQQTKTEPTVTLASSNNNNVSFSIKINGMLVADKKVGETAYQLLSIPDGELMMQEGSPQVPMITKLIAIPDCDNVSISVTYSNKLGFEKYNILPAPRFEKKKGQDGSDSQVEVFEENKSMYSSNAEFPGKYGEILETGYVRGQKVARVAIYPVQFNPISKTINAFTDFNINLTFVNPSSSVNKELGIFRNMMHHTALNYELSGISASTKIIGSASVKSLSKVAAGSVTRITNLNLLVGPSAMPVDYLIITHPNLFNSNSLTTLANHRKDYNGYDVAIIQVDSILFNRYSGPHYQDIRDFVSDVYLTGRANHTGDGHL